MGYLSNGKFVVTEDYGSNLQREIADEARKIYKEKYGKRNPDTLSSLELDRIKTEAAQIVMRRRTK